MARVAWGVRVSVSVAVTVEASVADAVAVFDRVPVAVDEIMAVTVYVIEPPAGSVGASEMLPDPDVLKPVAPPDPVAVQVSALMDGFSPRGSVTDIAVAVDGPV